MGRSRARSLRGAMKRRSLFPIAVVAVCLAAPAVHAKSLVEKVEAAYKKLQDYHARFDQQTYVSLIEKEVSQAGEISFAQGGKFRLTYTQTQSGRNYVCDGKKIVVTDPYLGSREVYKVNDPNVPQEALIFLGRLGSVGRFFDVKTADRKDQLILFPKDKNSVIQRLELVVDHKSYLVKEAKIVNITGNESTYLFKNPRTNSDLPGQLFSVD